MSAPISCMVIEDEPLAREILEGFIAQIPELKLVGTCQDALEAFQLLLSLQPDLIFLDIHMPESSGIELLKSLPRPPKVIFTTAYSEYAVEGFELNAVDYLLKPFSFARFQLAVEKVKKGIKGLSRPPSEDFITLKVDRKWVKIDLSTLLYIQSHGDYVKVHTSDTTWVSKGTLKALLQRLPEDRFIQLHKSYLCALKAIQYMEGNQVKIGADFLPIGAGYKENLLKALKL
ncbi:MAG: LytTR family DNA-binding domain-containing protein [Bacteroidota bacterium]